MKPTNVLSIVVTLFALASSGCATSQPAFQPPLKQAAENFQHAAEQGDRDAQYGIAEMYFYGNGVSKDIEQSVKWYRAAAEQGHVFAARALGDIYSLGISIPKNLDEADKWYRLAEQKQIYAVALNVRSKITLPLRKKYKVGTKNGNGGELKREATRRKP